MVQVVHVACLNAFDDLLHHRQPGSLSDEVSRGRKNLQKRARPQLVDLHVEIVVTRNYKEQVPY